MNIFSGYELLWLFFVYSFLGWVLEIVTAALKQRKFSNRGCLPASALWGVFGYIAVRWGNNLTLKLLSVFPGMFLPRAVTFIN